MPSHARPLAVAAILFAAAASWQCRWTGAMPAAPAEAPAAAAGPFVTVTRFKDEAEALEIANSTSYGLGGGLWTNNLQRAHRFADEIRSGMVWVNSYKRVHPGSPFGGVGESGYGREMGFEAMHEYTEAKSVWINVDAQIPPFYKR